MKSIVILLSALLAVLPLSGCSKKANAKTAASVSVSAVSLGAKTKAGKLVDVYEVQLDQASSLVVVFGGGKLEASGPAGLTLDGRMVEASPASMANQVVILEKEQGGYTQIPNLTPADAKAKCPPKGIIGLPVDETLAARPPPPGSSVR